MKETENSAAPTPEQIEEYCQELIKRLKKDNPKWEIQQEFGRMLTRPIASFTPQEMTRYNELKELLK